MKEFAPDYQRTETGLVVFPKDTPLRREMFPFSDPSEHIAKCNAYMIKALVEYLSEPGETLLDPFAGTGTIMVACMIGRKVIMLELEDTFVGLLEIQMAGLKKLVPSLDDLVTLIPGDANKILPIEDFCDHAVFSPPYPEGLKKKGEMDKTSKDLGYSAAADYSRSPENFTNLNDFMYHQRIELFYKKCLQSVKVGGTMTVIIKDNMIQGVRQLKGDRTIKDCERMGWRLEARNKWLARGGGYAAINRAAGLETVDVEDLITFRKLK